jgi:DNA-directed RNA polymerase subunit RPC12/RpoP
MRPFEGSLTAAARCRYCDHFTSTNPTWETGVRCPGCGEFVSVSLVRGNLISECGTYGDGICEVFAAGTDEERDACARSHEFARSFETLTRMVK